MGTPLSSEISVGAVAIEPHGDVVCCGKVPALELSGDNTGGLFSHEADKCDDPILWLSSSGFSTDLPINDIVNEAGRWNSDT